VVFVEDRLRIPEVEPVRRAAAPRQLHHPVEVVANHLGLGAVRVHAFEAPHLLHGLGVRFLGHGRLFHLDLVLLGLLHPRVGLAELGLDRPQLLAQVMLALRARHLVVGLRLDLRLHRGDVELPPQQRVHAAQAGQGIDDLQDLLGFGGPQLQIGSDEVGESPRLVHVGGDRQDLRRQVLERQQLLDAAAHRTHERLRLDAPIHFFVSGQGSDERPVRPLVVDKRIDRRLREALHQDLHPAISHAQDAHHHHDGSDPVEVVRFGILGLGIPLRGEQQQAITREGVLDGGNRPLPRDEEWQHHVGEDHQLSEGENRQLIGNRELAGRNRHLPILRLGQIAT